LEVGAEGKFKLDLRQDCDPGRQDCDPGKQKLKGAVRTETCQRHYCQRFVLQRNKLLGTKFRAEKEGWEISIRYYLIRVRVYVLP
jgi:hypothetical protein